MVSGLLSSSSSPSGWVVDQPRASSSAMMRPELVEGVLRFRFLEVVDEVEGEAVRYFCAR